MEIHVLMENRAGQSGLATEHGLSLLVQQGRRRILFDTGASASFLQNAEAKGLDLDAVDTVILSHAHYDHAGGLPAYLEGRCPGELLIGEGFFREKGKLLDGVFHDLGPGWEEGLLQGAGVRVRRVQEIADLGDGLFALGGLRAPGKGYFAIREKGVFIDDDFREELTLVMRVPEGLVVVVGCAHCGILNILKNVEKHFPQESVRLLLGGLHLSRLPDSEVSGVGKTLLALGIPRIGTAHCTGERLEALFPEGPFFAVKSGDRIVCGS